MHPRKAAGFGEHSAEARYISGRCMRSPPLEFSHCTCKRVYDNYARH